MKLFRMTTLALAVSLALLMVAGCNSASAPVNSNLVTEPTRTDVKKGVSPQADSEVAVIETADFGKIVIELYPNLAPQMVERFKKLIKEGFYDGTAIHRINRESGLLQGGDPLTRDDNPMNDGAGNSTYPDLPGEFSDVPFERGTVGAARRGARPAMAGLPAKTEEQARQTANSQFFITLQREPNFDEDYAVFGRVIEGIGTADIIAGAPVVPGTERPAHKIVITKITLEPRQNYPAGN